MRTLVVGPSWVGDMVMAHSLFQLLYRSSSDIIDVLAPSWTHSLLSVMPEVRRAISMPIIHGQLGFKTRWQLGCKLRTGNYQQAIVLPNSWKSALIPWAAKIPLRRGWRGEMRYGLINDIRKLDIKQYPLMVERFIALAYEASAPLPSQIPQPRLQLDASACQKTAAEFALCLKSKPVIAICPGAEFGPAKRWPAAYHAKVIQFMIAQGCQVWLFGSIKDQDIATEIVNSLPETSRQDCISLVAKTNLLQAIHLLSLSSLVISNDSGLMHVAAALQRPLIAVYGSSSVGFTPPLTEKKKIMSVELSCRPCFQRTCPLTHYNCLKQISPEWMIATVKNMLDQNL